MSAGEGSDAFLTAVSMTLSRDALWRNPPALAGDCEHDLECLTVIELRQTVICRKCGGLDAGMSRLLTSQPGAFPVAPDGSVKAVTLPVTITRGRHYEDDPPAPTEITYG